MDEGDTQAHAMNPLQDFVTRDKHIYTCVCVCARACINAYRYIYTDTHTHTNAHILYKFLVKSEIFAFQNLSTQDFHSHIPVPVVYPSHFTLLRSHISVAHHPPIDHMLQLTKSHTRLSPSWILRPL